jgi:hypothetical protein
VCPRDHVDQTLATSLGPAGSPHADEERPVTASPHGVAAAAERVPTDRRLGAHELEHAAAARRIRRRVAPERDRRSAGAVEPEHRSLDRNGGVRRRDLHAGVEEGGDHRDAANCCNPSNAHR